MDNIERAIRSALEKADSGTMAVRQRIYESAWSAQERALTASRSLNDEQKEQRRHDLRGVISRVEKEFNLRREQDLVQAAERAPVSLDDPLLDDPLMDVPAKAGNQDAIALDAGEVRQKKSRRERRAARQDADSRRNKNGKKRHSLFYNVGIPVLVLAVAGMIGYSLYNSFLNLSHRPASNPLHMDASLEPAKNGQSADGVQWVNIFTPANAERMSIKGRATANLQNEGNLSFVRIQSPGADDTVSFEVGPGVLEQLIGKKATFDIVAKSPDGDRTQIAVNCDLGGLGDCGRRRYDVNDSMNDYLFELDIPAGKSAGNGGTITISSDMLGSNKPVNIYAIRVTTAK